MRQKMIYRLFFFEHYSPSQIDRKMGLIDGTARSVIVEHWKWGNTPKP